MKKISKLKRFKFANFRMKLSNDFSFIFFPSHLSSIIHFNTNVKISGNYKTITTITWVNVKKVLRISAISGAH